MSDPTSVVVRNCDYWMRVAISLQICVKKALLDILHDQNIIGLPRDEQQLYQELQQFKQNQQHALGNLIKPFQWEMICHTCTVNCPNPCPRKGKTNPEDLDLTCIVMLIINLTKLQPPRGGWANPNDTSKAAYVILAQKLRNDINHCRLKEISTEQEFNNYWQEIENILIKLGYTDMRTFYDLKTISLDTKTNEKIAALTDQMNTLRADVESQQQQTCKELIQLRNIINDLKQKINGLEEDENMTEAQMVQLKKQSKCLEDAIEERLKLTERINQPESKGKQETSSNGRLEEINPLKRKLDETNKEATIIMSDPVSVVVPNYDYWMRVAISLQICVKKALLDILQDQNIIGLPRDEQQLYQELHRFKQNQQHALRNVIKSFQWEMMCHTCTTNCSNQCPREGKTNSENLDITCIVILIRNLTTLEPPQGGWTNPNDTNKAAYVIAARDLRNEINHSALKAISTEKQFNVYWGRIENILIGLDYTDMQTFYDLKTISLDTKTNEKIAALTNQMNTLRADVESEQQQTVQEKNRMHDIIDDLKQQIDGLVKDKNMTKAQIEQLQQQYEYFVKSMKIKIEEHDRKHEEHDRRDDEQDRKHQEHDRRDDEQDREIKELKQKYNHPESSSEITSKELSEKLKGFIKKSYKNVFAPPDNVDHVTTKKEKRDDVVVGLSLMETPENKPFGDRNLNNEESRSIMLESGIYRPTLRHSALFGDTPSLLHSFTPSKLLESSKYIETPSHPTIRHERKELEEASSKETDYNDIITEVQDYVIISGPPGCGKSTLCETLAYNWGCNDLWNNIPNFAFVFVLTFRDLNDFKEKENVTSEEILSDFYPEYFKDVKKISNSNSLLILDGFDEFLNRDELLHTRDKYSSFTRAVFDLLNPKKRLFSARLVTSRPASCLHLIKLLKSESFTDFRIFKITGFNFENIRNYATQYWSSRNGNKEKLEPFLTKLKETQILRSMMTIPFYCSGVCCLMFDGEVGIDSIPMTYTGLFCNLLTLFLRDHGLKRRNASLKEILKTDDVKTIILLLSRFAFLMEQEGKITFTERDFQLNFGEGNNFENIVKESGLIIKLEKKGSHFYQFLHYSFHEFLVALYHYHIGLCRGIKNPYTLSMVGGLVGGLVENSNSNFYVIEYAKMFQSTNSTCHIQDVFWKTVKFSIFAMTVFEYQNKLNLTKDNNIKITMKTLDSDINIYHENFLLSEKSDIHESSKYMIVFVNHPTHMFIVFNEMKLNFGKVILLSSYSETLDINDINRLPRVFKYTNNVECIVRKFHSVACHHTYEHSFPDVNITMHMFISDFNELMETPMWREELGKWCKMFKTFTVSLYKDSAQSKLSLLDISDKQRHYHSGCIPQDFIQEVRGISRKHHDIENLTLSVSCIIGVEENQQPCIHKITTEK